MFRNKSRVFLLGMLLWPVTLMAQQTMTIQQAQEYALQNSPQMKNSQLDIEEGQTVLQSRTSVGLPQINASVGYNHFITLPTSLIPAEFFGGEPGDFAEVQFGTPENMTAGISASQLIFSGPYIYGVQAAKMYVELLQQENKVEAQDVKKNVELAYYSVLIADELIRMTEQNLEVLSKTLHEVSELYKAGFVEEIDVDRLRISESTLQTTLGNANRQKAFAIQVLKFQMGMNQQEGLALADSLSTLPMDMVMIDNDQNYLNRPEFIVLNTTRELNELNVKVNKAAYYPTLALIGSYEQAAQRNSFNFFDTNEPWFETFLVGVQLNVPIFSGMQKSAAVEQAQIGLNRISVAEQTLRESVQLEIAQHTAEYLNATDNYNNQISNMELADKIYNTATIKYREGLGSSLELTDAESIVLNAQTNYFNALYNLLTAKTNLRIALGYQ